MLHLTDTLMLYLSVSGTRTFAHSSRTSSKPGRRTQRQSSDFSPASLPRETFFVTVRLADSLGHHEQVFLAVDSIVGDQVAGRIWSQIEAVAGYHLRQPYRTSEGEIVDWLIAKPDGSEEGNVTGKFLDTYQPPRDCPSPGGDRVLR